MSMAETQDYDVVIKRLKEILKLPTAFFCCNDIEAITIIKGLSSMGIKIPEDISIIGFLTILNCQRTFHQN